MKQPEVNMKFLVVFIAIFAVVLYTQEVTSQEAAASGSTTASSTTAASNSTAASDPSGPANPPTGGSSGEPAGTETGR